MTTIEVDLDDARALMYDDLVDLLGEERVRDLLKREVRDVVTEAYDRREGLAQQVEQAEQMQAQQ